MSETFEFVKIRPRNDIANHDDRTFDFGTIDMQYITEGIYRQAQELAEETGRMVAIQGARFTRTTITQGALRRKKTVIEEVEFPTIEFR